MYWSAGATDPILSKSKKNITKFWLISFLKNFLHYVFTPLFTIFRQKQERFIICQKMPPELLCKKRRLLKIPGISQKNTCAGISF